MWVRRGVKSKHASLYVCVYVMCCAVSKWGKEGGVLVGEVISEGGGGGICEGKGGNVLGEGSGVALCADEAAEGGFVVSNYKSIVSSTRSPCVHDIHYSARYTTVLSSPRLARRSSDGITSLVFTPAVTIGGSSAYL
jgi:hypothetical protein